jgi:hypothetical protein
MCFMARFELEGSGSFGKYMPYNAAFFEMEENDVVIISMRK